MISGHLNTDPITRYTTTMKVPTLRLLAHNALALALAMCALPCLHAQGASSERAARAETPFLGSYSLKAANLTRDTGMLDPFQPDIDLALRRDVPTNTRVAQIDELGRTGHAGMVESLRGLLQDAEPDVRSSTFRAIMRLNPDGARDDMLGVLSNAEATPRDSAWAIRALARTSQPSLVMPSLIEALKHRSPAVRGASVDALRDMTGLTMGARPQLLFPQDDIGTDLDTTVDRWQNWWQANKEAPAEDWPLKALESQNPAEVASASRTLRAESRHDALKALVATLERLKTEGTSASREAVAQALRDLTGRSTEYTPYAERGMTQAEWDAQHDAALDIWRRAAESDPGPEDDTRLQRLLNLLEAPEARSRYGALTSLAEMPITGQPLIAYVRMLRDPSEAVAEQAHKCLVGATGMKFPWNSSLRSQEDQWQRKVDIQRWKDWVDRFGSTPESMAAGIGMFFQRDEDLQDLGRTGAAHTTIPSTESEAVWQRAQKAFRESLTGLRAHAALHIARYDIPVNQLLLLDTLELEMRSMQLGMSGSKESVRPPSTALQAYLFRALARRNDPLALSVIERRLELGLLARSSLQTAVPRDIAQRNALKSASDNDVIRQCLLCIGEYGPQAERMAGVLADFTKEEVEPSPRNRMAAAEALGQVGSLLDQATLERIVLAPTEFGEGDQARKVFDRDPWLRVGGIYGLHALAVRYPEIRTSIARKLADQVVNYQVRDSAGSSFYPYPREVRDAARKALRSLSILNE